jgi:hypothetical protein
MNEERSSETDARSSNGEERTSRIARNSDAGARSPVTDARSSNDEERTSRIARNSDAGERSPGTLVRNLLAERQTWASENHLRRPSPRL